MSFDEVTEHSVYTCTGQPLPTDIAKIVEWMLNKDFSSAYQGEKNGTYDSELFQMSTLVASGLFSVLEYRHIGSEVRSYNISLILPTDRALSCTLYQHLSSSFISLQADKLEGCCHRHLATAAKVAI